MRGATRVFDVNDIVTLWVYGKLLDEGVVPRRAGSVACGLRTLLSEHPEANRVVYVVNSHGSSVWLRRDDLSIEHNTVGGASIVSAKEWFLEFPRMRVIHELQEEAATLGAADDE